MVNICSNAVNGYDISFLRDLALKPKVNLRARKEAVKMLGTIAHDAPAAVGSQAARQALTEVADKAENMEIKGLAQKLLKPLDGPPHNPPILPLPFPK